MAETKRATFRLSDACRDMIRDIGEHQGGLTQTRVIEWAVERLHAAVEEHRKKTKKLPDSRLDLS